MGKYYCDYCDTYLTHDSPSVRKTHNGGRRHKENVRLYYVNWLEQQAQSFRLGMIRPLAPGLLAPPGVMPIPPMGMPPGMMMPPMGLPPRPGMMPPPGMPLPPRPPMIPPPASGPPPVSTAAPVSTS